MMPGDRKVIEGAKRVAYALALYVALYSASIVAIAACAAILALKARP